MTSSYQIAPPAPFNFSRTDEWPRWIRRFERFRQASGLVEKSEENQVNTLIYAADDIFQAFMLHDEDKKKYEVVKYEVRKIRETFHEEKKHYIRTRHV